jgi:hypothetical protein
MFICAPCNRPCSLVAEVFHGHLKAEHRMGRNYLAHHAGDAVNAVLAAAGYNFHLELLLSRFLAAQKAAAALQWV